MSHGIVARYEHRQGHGNERKMLRGEGEDCQRACHLCFRTAVLHETHGTAASQWMCRAPDRDVENANPINQVKNHQIVVQISKRQDNLLVCLKTDFHNLLIFL